MMCFHDAVGDAQAETRTRYPMLHRRTSVEPFEYTALFLGWYPLATIRELHNDCAIAAVYSDTDRRTRRRILQRVVEKLLASKLYQSSIDADGGQLVIAGHFERAIFDLGSHRSNDLTNKVGHVRELQ